MWDMRVKGCIQTFAEEYQVTSVAFADASDKVYTGGIDNTVRVWDLRKSEVFMKLEVRAPRPCLLVGGLVPSTHAASAYPYSIVPNERS